MNKSQIKSHVAKIMVALGGFVTVAESCDKRVYTPLGSENFAKDRLLGDSLLPVNVYLSDDINVEGMIQFAQDVLSKPDFKEVFYRNPKQVLSEYGIESYDIDSPQIQVILASADPDVQQKIADKDFKGYLHILEQKNYLQTDVVRFMLATMDAGLQIDTKSADVTYGCVLVIPVVLGAVLVLAVALALVVAGYVDVVAYTELTTRGASIDDIPILSEDAVTLYLDQTKSLETKDLTEAEYVSRIREILGESNITDDPETANTLFQYGCGTAEHLIDDLSKEQNDNR